MKPIKIRRKNKGIGARVRVWTGGKPARDLGTIVGEKQSRNFHWNYNSHYKKYMLSYSSLGYLVKCDNYSDEEGNKVVPFEEHRIAFLEKIEIEKPRKCPDLKKLVSNLEPHEIIELKSLLNQLQ